MPKAIKYILITSLAMCLLFLAGVMCGIFLVDTAYAYESNKTSTDIQTHTDMPNQDTTDIQRVSGKKIVKLITEKIDNLVFAMLTEREVVSSWNGRGSSAVDQFFLNQYQNLPSGAWIGISTQECMLRTAATEIENQMTHLDIAENNNKYNTWYYNRNVNGEEYNWNITFLTWCAAQCGLVRTGVFPDTNNVQEMYSYFINHIGFETDQLKPNNFSNTQNGDILFVREHGELIFAGLITEIADDHVTVLIGNFDHKLRTVTYAATEIASTHKDQTYDYLVVHIVYPSVQMITYNYLTNEVHLNRAVACGLLANAYFETRFNPYNKGDGLKSYGMFAWHLDAYDGLVQYCNERDIDWVSIEGQLSYLKWEITEQHPGFFKALNQYKNTQSDAYNAAAFFAEQFELPGISKQSKDERGASAYWTFYPSYKIFDRIHRASS